MSSRFKNIISLATAVNSVVAFAVYYHVALTTKVLLEEMYFLSIAVNFSLLFLTLYYYIESFYIKACLLGASVFFGGLSVTFLTDWIVNGVPKMNHVYQCFIFGVGTSLLLIATKWITSYFRQCKNG